MKTKKASLTLNNSRKPVSAIAWDPNNSTKLLTSTPDDNTPVIFLWDLRNSNAPERTLQGHEQGVLSLSWCSQDSDLALSSGKDNKTIVWNPQTGERLGELPELTNWTFQTRFNPHNPNLSATASFDGKITVQTLQNTNPDTTQATADKNLNDEDFFSQAQTQPQDASWSLAQAPKWFERPVGVTFGFGGKLVVFKANPAKPGQKRSSNISIAGFSVDSEVSSATEKFQTAIASGDLTGICSDKIEQSKTDEEKADWQVMQTLVGENPRGKIVEYLGFNEEDLANGDAKADGEDDTKDKAAAADEAAEKDDAKKKELSKMFDGGDGEDDDFLTDLTATKGAKTDNPFQLFSDSDTSVEKDITKAIMLGNFAKATDICLKEDRMADAFLIANCGGQELVDKVQSAYLSKKDGVPSYMRLLGSVVNKNLWDVVYNADLANWKETMAILCTFSDPAEFPDLCEALGDRINDEGDRKDASFCFLVGSKLEKVVSIWVAELEEAEQAGINQGAEGSTFSVHAKSLQNFIEKVTVFREVSKFTDSDKELSSGWKLATLYDKYTEYADILAGHGQLDVAQKYLDLLPANYAAAEIARNRVRLATQKTGAVPRAAASTAAARQPASASRTTSRMPPVQGYQPTQTPLVPAPAPSANPYAPSPPTQGYAPPTQGYAPSQNPYAPHQPAFGAAPPQPGFPGAVGPPPMAGPPRNQTPTGPPPASKVKSTENWNDVPMVTRAPPPRRSTPSAAPITSPFPGSQQASPSAPPPAGPYGGRAVASPPPPPPKGPAPARVQSPLVGPPQGPPRPSSAANMYAPPAPVIGGAAPGVPGVVQPPVPTASPYNAPPAGPPPSNRYTPAPTPQQATPQPGAAPIAPPPSAAAVRPPPAANPYAPSPVQQAPPSNPYAPAPSPYAPPTAQQTAPPPAAHAPPPTGPPPMGGSPGARPGPPPGATPTPPPAAAAVPPPKQRHPPGDRSHIPANAQPLVETFTAEMQRVASKAPANFTAQVKDTQKRLGLLFDHLNNEELVQPATVEELSQIAQALQGKDYATAQRLQVDIQTNKTDECGNWMVRFQASPSVH